MDLPTFPLTLLSFWFSIRHQKVIIQARKVLIFPLQLFEENCFLKAFLKQETRSSPKSLPLTVTIAELMEQLCHLCTLQFCQLTRSDTEKLTKKGDNLLKRIKQLDWLFCISDSQKIYMSAFRVHYITLGGKVKLR